MIVDVPASTVNQMFDYNIPEKFLNILQPGMRVIIPFGPRKITGFVIMRTNHSVYDNLKDIIDVLDIVPPLTNELLKLGKWLAEETICLYITAYHAMLPHVLKAKYNKEIIRLTNDQLSSNLEQLFKGRQRVAYSEFENREISYEQLQKAIQNGDVAINYLVGSQIAKKYVTFIKPNQDENVLRESLNELPKQATRQKQILTYFLNNPRKVEQGKLYNQLDINRSHLKRLLEQSLLAEEKVEIYREPYEQEFPKTEPLPLTKEQEIAIAPINQKIENNEHDVFLLHGVTGSGKTEIYLQSIQEVIKKGKEAIVLVPEISLTPQMVKRFKGRFGSKVAVLHSALSAGEKYDEWRKVLRGEVQVVVGARSAIFAPFKNLGIIIIDEEHELTYKQEEHPRYHARDVAIKRGKTYRCPVVLGSATPLLESYARAKKGVFQLLTLMKRTNEQPMPQVDIVDMRKELHAGNRTMFSQVLTDKIKHCIKQGQQIVLLLNRRGYATFSLCRDCGHVQECPHCDIALTYHKHHHVLRCHYCSYEEPMPNQCPACQSHLFRFFGTGTERVEEALTKLIPEARVIRMDVDTTRRKGAHEQLLHKFANHDADILLGTQMIAKGLDFQNVTLVGVLAADSMLHLPDFRSSEKTFQLLTQVSGRAGRHKLLGEVIIQTYTPDHYSIELASQYDYEQFYRKEMIIRRAFQYPPYVFLALLTISHENQVLVMQIAQEIVQYLLKNVQKNTVVLGPSPSPIARIKKRYRYQIILKYRHEPNLHAIIQKAMQKYAEDIRKDLQITADMQPYQLM